MNWIEEQGWSICERAGGHRGELVPIRLSLEELLARRFGIDLRKVEAEKCAMLASFSASTADA